MSSVAKRRAGALKKAYLCNLFTHKNFLPLNTKCIGRFEVKDGMASISCQILQRIFGGTLSILLLATTKSRSKEMPISRHSQELVRPESYILYSHYSQSYSPLWGCARYRAEMVVHCGTHFNMAASSSTISTCSPTWPVMRIENIENFHTANQP